MTAVREEKELERPTATAAFVCAIIGAIIGLIPFLGILAIPLGVIGLTLGWIGWKKRARLARASMILGALAVVFGVIGIVIVNDAFNELETELEELENQ